MPRKGYKSVTVPESVIDMLKEIMELEGLGSIPETIRHLALHYFFPDSFLKPYHPPEVISRMKE